MEHSGQVGAGQRHGHVTPPGLPARLAHALARGGDVDVEQLRPRLGLEDLQLVDPVRLRVDLYVVVTDDALQALVPVRLDHRSLL